MNFQELHAHVKNNLNFRVWAHRNGWSENCKTFIWQKGEEPTLYSTSIELYNQFLANEDKESYPTT
jgi:hypothetical protein